MIWSIYYNQKGCLTSELKPRGTGPGVNFMRQELSGNLHLTEFFLFFIWNFSVLFFGWAYFSSQNEWKDMLNFVSWNWSLDQMLSYLNPRPKSLAKRPNGQVTFAWRLLSIILWADLCFMEWNEANFFCFENTFHRSRVGIKSKSSGRFLAAKSPIELSGKIK